MTVTRLSFNEAHRAQSHIIRLYTQKIISSSQNVIWIELVLGD